jgi:hypothetical protein
MVITSYNYIDKEILQLESLAFVETSKENFAHQVGHFENDKYMKLAPIAFAL